MKVSADPGSCLKKSEIHIRDSNKYMYQYDN